MKFRYRTSPNSTSDVWDPCPKCEGKYLIACVKERDFLQVLEDYCNELEPSEDNFNDGVLDVETDQVRSPYGMSFAVDYDELWRLLRNQLDPTGTLSLMGFDVFYLPNGESFKVRWCPCLRHAGKNKLNGKYTLTDIVKSSDGSFWYGFD